MSNSSNKKTPQSKNGKISKSRETPEKLDYMYINNFLELNLII